MDGEEKERMLPQACRDHVRETFFFKVRFQRLCREEYDRKKAEWDSRVYFERTGVQLSDLDADTPRGAPLVDAQLLGLFLEMDEKIDQIIAHLTGKTAYEGFWEQGIGINLSGGGMRVRVENSLEKGQLLCAHLLLSKIPLIRVMVLGQVIYAKPQQTSENSSYHDVGVQFLELDAEDRERIIASVFQRQREVLRKKKGKDGAYEEDIKDHDCGDRISCTEDSHS